MKVKVQTLDAKAGRRHRARRRRSSASSRAPTSSTASSPGSSPTAAAPARAARERSDVARTGKKFGRQKGGGTARHGDRRAPIFIGGGKAHGPRVRVFTLGLNKKVRALGLKMALSSKAKDGKLIVIDNLDVKDGKTKALRDAARQARLRQDRAGDRRRCAERRLRPRLVEPAASINLMPAVGANVYDIMRHETLVLTRAAVEKLEARFNG